MEQAEKLTFLHGVFKFAMKRQWATSNPVTFVDRPRAPPYKHRRLRFLTPEELEPVIRQVLDDDLGAVERPLYRCAAMTGLRQGELIALRWCDVDWSASRVRVAESYSRGQMDTPKSHQGRRPCGGRVGGFERLAGVHRVVPAQPLVERPRILPRVRIREPPRHGVGQACAAHVRNSHCGWSPE